ncbi:MAG: glycoside hydrolase family 26 protein [Prevotella sp.]|nr:glycoside hydrolase family 26 protein [Prevotella sp.]
MNKFILTMAALMIATVAGAKSPVKKLYKRLLKLEKKGVMIGHQDDPLYGTTWKWDVGRSDVKETCGDYPAVMGFELGGIENGGDKSLDGVPFDRIRKEIVLHHNRGGIVTISWHPWNPVTGNNAWDPKGKAVAGVLPGGAQNAKFKGWLLTVAAFMKSLKTDGGKAVPVIFRPWHEMSGGWFWWGKDSCTPDEYQQLFRYTVDQLKAAGVSNLLYCYCPGGTVGETEANYMKFYPGDRYVDMLGVDVYNSSSTADYVARTKKELDVMRKIARERRKLYALTETGYRNTPQADWFTTGMWAAVKGSGASYVLLWRNAWDQPEENFGPAPEKSCADDFRKLAEEPEALFLNDVK